MDNKEMKLKRLTCNDGMPISENAYNAAIGLTILWGILLNVLTALFLTPYLMKVNYWVILIGYVVLSFACIGVVFKSHTPAISFLGFTGLAFVMGVLLTFFLTGYTSSTIYSAFLTTGIIVIAMMILSMFFPAFFLSLGRVLLFALIGSIVIELIGGLLLHLPLGIIDYVVVVIFAGYIGYDWAKAQAYPKTLDNAIDSAADIYIDIVNIFIRVLSIIGKKDN